MKIGQALAWALRFVSRMRSIVRVALGPLLLGCLPCAVGCARSAEERQLSEMRDTIEQVQAERDQSDSKAMDEPLGPGEVPLGPGGAEPAPGAASRPASTNLDAYGEDFAGDEDSDAADADDTSPRPMVRLFGPMRPGARGLRGEDQVDSSNADEWGNPQGSAQQSPALDPQAKRSYDSALALVNAKKYDAALDALAAFLVKWPDHPYADNAMYWRGECYFARGQYAPAAEQFEGVVTRFPTGNKAADALLKLGISKMKLGDPTKAKELFDRLAQQFPKSDAAKHIPPVTVPSSTAGPAEDHR